MGEQRWPGLLAEVWGAVAGDVDAIQPAELCLDGAVPVDRLPSTLPVADAAVACVGVALLAAAELSGSGLVSLNSGHLAAAVRSERYLRIDGQPVGTGFASLSRFWPAADGWVRTHANYPWHRRALLAALGVPDVGSGDADSDAIAAELGRVVVALPAIEVERRVVDAGGVAAALRSPERWLSHPAGRAVAEVPLIGGTVLDGGQPRRRPVGPLPACGVRVLDLTRVIAGPVATRFLGALGADVLRLDPPHRRELRLHRYDGLLGKRSALLDATTSDGLATLHELLDTADVLVHGYRPGALSRFGLDADSLARHHPGLVVVALSAWGSHGPWGARRGFDSIVQVATGIAARESHGSADAWRPGALPCQLLDHGTGYLCAAAALHGLRRQAQSGGTPFRELSLARTAHWLLTQPATARLPAAERPEDSEWLTILPSHAGPITTVTPPGALDGQLLHWPELALDYGSAPAGWSPRSEPGSEPVSRSW